ncbi:MAG: fumarylacetoacetate hydrolase family protein [Comamonas sp.]|nr:fumarylacetoacetate hydrolase family protein [Comamonas sp.]
MNYVIIPPEQASVAVTGTEQRFPVHRIYCVGRNYADHAREMGSSGREAPFFFTKPADAALSAVADQVITMPYPTLTGDLHHEIELVAAIGKGGSDIAVADAPGHIWGFAVGLDMTRRDLQADAKKLGRPWCIAKGFDASAPIAPITPVARAGDIAHAEIWLKVNGEARQSGRIEQMIWNLAEIVSHLSRAWQLAPGDLIYTGTPAGVGAVRRGDVLEGGITGLTPLHVRVA